MTRRAFLACAGAGLVVLAGWPLHASAAAAPFDPARDAAADVAAAVAQAGAQGKRVIVDVGGEWCAWCHIMDRFFEQDAEAAQLRDRGFVWVKVNFSPQNRNEALLSRWPRVAGYPHLFVLDGDGKLLHSQSTAELEAGRGYDRERMLRFLRRWSAAAPRGTTTS
jgi:thiol:disulfide interchange protein